MTDFINIFLQFLVAISTIVIAYVLYVKFISYNYWWRRGLYYIEPTFPYGNMTPGKASFADQFINLYNHIRSKGLKHAGGYLFARPMYVPTDPEIIKFIVQKDFVNFNSHGTYVNERDDPLSGHLFNLEGPKWRKMRTKLTPTFTSGKMKMMFHTFVKSTEGLRDIFDEAAANHETLDIKDVMGRFTTDIIGNCAFGIECNSMKEPNNEFRKYGKAIFQRSAWQRFKFNIVNLFPRSFLRAIRFRIAQKEIEQFFMNLVRDTINYRETNNVYRKDFMHLLLQLKNFGTVTDDEKIFSDGNEDAKNKISFNELVAQVFVFFLAGFETSSTAMTFAIYELAKNQEIQNKLREEIKTVLEKYNNEITYEAVMEMKYLDNVINESLRKYPPVPVLPRVCTQDSVIPGVDFKLEKGTRVQIPVMGLHMDPEYFPNPEVFNPDRFNKEESAKRHPFTFIPFGEGPRMCIGLRFGVMQSKIGLLTAIKNYKITLNEKTKNPLTLDKNQFICTPEGGVWINLQKI